MIQQMKRLLFVATIITAVSSCELITPTIEDQTYVLTNPELVINIPQMAVDPSLCTDPEPLSYQITVDSAMPVEMRSGIDFDGVMDSDLNKPDDRTITVFKDYHADHNFPSFVGTWEITVYGVIGNDSVIVKFNLIIESPCSNGDIELTFDTSNSKFASHQYSIGTGAVTAFTWADTDVIETTAGICGPFSYSLEGAALIDSPQEFYQQGSSLIVNSADFMKGSQTFTFTLKVWYSDYGETTASGTEVFEVVMVDNCDPPQFDSNLVFEDYQYDLSTYKVFDFKTKLQDKSGYSPNYCPVSQWSYVAVFNSVEGQYSEMITLNTDGQFTFSYPLDDSKIGNYAITVTVEMGTTTKVTQSWTFNLVVKNSCPDMVVTYPTLEDQVYTVGDPVNEYRFNSFIFSRDDCGEPLYFYSMLNLDGSFAPSFVYNMMQSRIYDTEPKLQLGQYYPNNNLMLTVQDEYKIETYAKVGEFTTEIVTFKITFVDPCQNAVITLNTDIFKSFDYQLWDSQQTISWTDGDGASIQNNGYSFCSTIDYRISKAGSDSTADWAYEQIDSPPFSTSVNTQTTNYLRVYSDKIEHADNSPYTIVVEAYLKLYSKRADFYFDTTLVSTEFTVTITNPCTSGELLDPDIIMLKGGSENIEIGATLSYKVTYEGFFILVQGSFPSMPSQCEKTYELLVNDSAPPGTSIALLDDSFGTTQTKLAKILIDAPTKDYLSDTPIKVSFKATLTHSTKIPPATSEVFFYVNTIDPCEWATISVSPIPEHFLSTDPPVLEAFVRSPDSIDLDARTAFESSSSELTEVCGPWNYSFTYDPLVQDRILTSPEDYLLSIWAQQESTMGEYDVKLKVWQGDYQSQSAQISVLIKIIDVCYSSTFSHPFTSTQELVLNIEYGLFEQPFFIDVLDFEEDTGLCGPTETTIENRIGGPVALKGQATTSPFQYWKDEQKLRIETDDPEWIGRHVLKVTGTLTESPLYAPAEALIVITIVNCKVTVPDPPQIQDVVYTAQSPMILFQAPLLFAQGLNDVECGYEWTYAAYEVDTGYLIDDKSQPVAFHSFNSTFSIFSSKQQSQLIKVEYIGTLSNGLTEKTLSFDVTIKLAEGSKDHFIPGNTAPYLKPQPQQKYHLQKFYTPVALELGHVVDNEDDMVDIDMVVQPFTASKLFELRYYYSKVSIRMQPGLDLGVYYLQLNMTDRHDNAEMSRVFDIMVEIVELEYEYEDTIEQDDLYGPGATWPEILVESIDNKGLVKIRFTKRMKRQDPALITPDVLDLQFVIYSQEDEDRILPFRRLDSKQSFNQTVRDWKAITYSPKVLEIQLYGVSEQLEDNTGVGLITTILNSKLFVDEENMRIKSGSVTENVYVPDTTEPTESVVAFEGLLNFVQCLLFYVLGISLVVSALYYKESSYWLIKLIRAMQLIVLLNLSGQGLGPTYQMLVTKLAPLVMADFQFNYIGAIPVADSDSFFDSFMFQRSQLIRTSFFSNMMFVFLLVIIWIMCSSLYLCHLNSKKYKDIKANRAYFSLKRALFWDQYKFILQLIYLPLVLNSFLCATLIVDEGFSKGDDWQVFASKIASVVSIGIFVLLLPFLHILATIFNCFKSKALQSWRISFDPLEVVVQVVAVLLFNKLPLLQFALIFGYFFVAEVASKTLRASSDNHHDKSLMFHRTEESNKDLALIAFTALPSWPLLYFMQDSEHDSWCIALFGAILLIALALLVLWESLSQKVYQRFKREVRARRKMLYCEILILVRLERQRKQNERVKLEKQRLEDLKMLELKVIEEDSDFIDSDYSGKLRDNYIIDDLRIKKHKSENRAFTDEEVKSGEGQHSRRAGSQTATVDYEFSMNRDSIHSSVGLRRDKFKLDINGKSMIRKRDRAYIGQIRKRRFQKTFGSNNNRVMALEDNSTILGISNSRRLVNDQSGIKLDNQRQIETELSEKFDHDIGRRTVSEYGQTSSGLLQQNRRGSRIDRLIKRQRLADLQNDSNHYFHDDSDENFSSIPKSLAEQTRILNRSLQSVSPRLPEEEKKSEANSFENRFTAEEIKEQFDLYESIRNNHKSKQQEDERKEKLRKKNKKLRLSRKTTKKKPVSRSSSSSQGDNFIDFSSNLGPNQVETKFIADGARRFGTFKERPVDNKFQVNLIQMPGSTPPANNLWYMEYYEKHMPPELCAMYQKGILPTPAQFKILMLPYLMPKLLRRLDGELTVIDGQFDAIKQEPDKSLRRQRLKKLAKHQKRKIKQFETIIKSNKKVQSLARKGKLLTGLPEESRVFLEHECAQEMEHYMNNIRKKFKADRGRQQDKALNSPDSENHLQDPHPQNSNSPKDADSPSKQDLAGDKSPEVSESEGPEPTPKTRQEPVDAKLPARQSTESMEQIEGNWQIDESSRLDRINPQTKTAEVSKPESPPSESEYCSEYESEEDSVHSSPQPQTQQAEELKPASLILAGHTPREPPHQTPSHVRLVQPRRDNRSQSDFSKLIGTIGLTQEVSMRSSAWDDDLISNRPRVTINETVNHISAARPFRRPAVEEENKEQDTSPNLTNLF